MKWNGLAAVLILALGVGTAMAQSGSSGGTIRRTDPSSRPTETAPRSNADTSNLPGARSPGSMIGGSTRNAPLGDKQRAEPNQPGRTPLDRR